MVRVIRGNNRRRKASQGMTAVHTKVEKLKVMAGKRNYKRSGKALEITGPSGKRAVLTLANGKKLVFMCRWKSGGDKSVLRIVNGPRSTRIPTRKEVKELKTFRAVLKKTFGWSFEVII